MNVKDCMTMDIATVSTDATFREVKEMMVEKDVSAVLVEAGDAIVGLVTDTDILAHAAAGKNLDSLKVGKYMTVCEVGGINPCLQVFEDSPVEDAIKIMAISGVNHLLVWGKGGHVCGVISSKDVLKTME